MYTELAQSCRQQADLFFGQISGGAEGVCLRSLRAKPEKAGQGARFHIVILKKG